MNDLRHNNTKILLIDTMIEEIKKKGYQEVSIREVTKKNHLTATTLYKHFKNKEELLEETLKKVSQGFEEYIADCLEKRSPENSYQALITLGEANIMWSEEEPFLTDFLFFSPTALKGFHQYLSLNNSPFLGLNKSYEMLLRFIEEYQLSMDPENLFIQLWSFIQGYTTLIRNGLCSYDRNLLGDTLKLLMHDKCL